MTYSFSQTENRVLDYGLIKNVLNQRSFSLIHGAFMTGRKSNIRRVRRELGLKTPWPFWEVLHPHVSADFPIISTVDTTLWPRPPDHPPHWYPTGFLVTHDEDLEMTESDKALQEWIDSRKDLHRPLLFFGQGSFDHHDQDVFTDILLDALDQLGMDAIALSSTVAGDRDLSNMAHIRVVKELDQNIFFPQVSVISHHGGAGTASQCIRSGRPGICIPSMSFQEIWCGQLQDYGAGVLLKHKELQESWQENRTNVLAISIQRVLQPSVLEKAKDLGDRAKKVGGKAGVKLAAHKIEEELRRLVAWNGSRADAPDL
jgi:sterol 3beta-glucosyltransferase